MVNLSEPVRSDHRSRRSEIGRFIEGECHTPRLPLEWTSSGPPSVRYQDVDPMISSTAWDVVILGSGIAGLAGALAARELGLRPVVLEKASTLGGGTVNSYGLIWVGQNHLAP